jgi:hypothetical protein
MAKMHSLGKLIESVGIEGVAPNASRKVFPSIFLEKAPADLAMLDAGDEGEAIIKYRVARKSIDKMDSGQEITEIVLDIEQIGMKESDSKRIMTDEV